MSEPRSEAAVRVAARSIALRMAASVYGLAARGHRAWRSRTRVAAGRPSCAIVSVGGLTVGGAGKTPVAARLARALSERGHRVVLASRGYRGAARDAVTIVSDGTRVHASVERAGDESLVLAAHAPGVPVLVGRDRRVVGHRAVAAFDAQVLVVDDGFQHHLLARDFDLVCVDGRAGFGNGRVLPAGPLREPLSALRVADAVCIVDGGSSPPVGVEIGAHVHEGTPVVRVRRHAVDLVPLGGGESRPAVSLAGRRVGMIAGIARPASLRRTLEGLGAQVLREECFPDHHVYRETDLRTRVVEGESPPDGWITTEKDALKILPDWLPAASVEVLRIEAAFGDEPALVDRIEARLRAAGRLI